MSATTDDNESHRRQQDAALKDTALVDRDDSTARPNTPAAADDRDAPTVADSVTAGNTPPVDDSYRNDEWPGVPPVFPDTAEDSSDWMGLPPSFDDVENSADEDLDDDQWHRAETTHAPGITADTDAGPPTTKPAETPPPEHRPAAPASTAMRWRPAGLAAIAILVAGLLAFGAYVLIRQGSALQAEVTFLQSQLETAVLPADALADRELRRTLMQRNEFLENELANLQLESARLEARLADELATYQANNAALEQDLLAARQRQVAPTKTAPPTSGTAPTAPEAPASAVAEAGAGGWFVNFGSYGQRALAQRWVDRLDVTTGEVIVQEAIAGGKPVYRVRIVGLETRSRADELARALESQYQLPPLWVGRD